MDRLESKFKVTKVIKQILFIYFVHLFQLSVEGKSTILDILQTFLQTLFEETNKRDSSL